MNEIDTLTTMVLQAKNEPEKIRQILAQKICRLLFEALNTKDYEQCLRLGALAKRCKTPVENLDFMRALTFMNRNEIHSAREALKEELRYFPQNAPAKNLLEQLYDMHPTHFPPDASDDFRELYKKISSHTMVSIDRVHNLYKHALHVCTHGPKGSFVECGVAGGGTSGLLASVIKRAGGATKLFCCDSFSGMPPATEYDKHGHIDAEASGWGCGTCAAPESSLITLCNALFAQDVIHIVKGYFEDTLPTAKASMGGIAFLHMDGDWYTSTKAILENLYDQLVPGAFVQIDDYGYWEGCRKAVHDFFDSRGISHQLTTIDASGVFFFKN